MRTLLEQLSDPNTVGYADLPYETLYLPILTRVIYQGSKCNISTT